MAHDVFISYANPDKKAADAVCGTLEQQGIRCCIFPRDGIPGKSFAETIAEFMGQCRVVVLVLSSHANSSKHISREVEMAVRRGLTVIPFRIEEVQPTGSLEYWIAETHWLDAITPEMERGLKKLVDWVRPHVTVVERPEATGGPSVDAAAQYRLAVEMVWADRTLDRAEADSLAALAARLGLAATVRQELERAVMGDSADAILVRSRRAAAAGEERSSARSDSTLGSRPAFCRKCGTSLATAGRFCR